VTGLTRHHIATADPLITLTSGSPLYGTPAGTTNSIAIGPTWLTRATDAQWFRLSSFSYKDMANSSSSLVVISAAPGLVSFTVTYQLKRSSSQPVSAVKEWYTVTPTLVNVTTTFTSSSPLARTGVIFPVFRGDGERTSDFELLHGETLAVELAGDSTSQLGTTCAEFHTPRLPSSEVAWDLEKSSSRNGYMYGLRQSTDSMVVSYQLRARAAPCERSSSECQGMR
jgi:hypothetical protein